MLQLFCSMPALWKLFIEDRNRSKYELKAIPNKYISFVKKYIAFCFTYDIIELC